MACGDGCEVAPVEEGVGQRDRKRRLRLTRHGPWVLLAVLAARSMAKTAVGTRGELIGSRATGGFALVFKADALWVARRAICSPARPAGSTPPRRV